jgi:hypothetical protein
VVRWIVPVTIICLVSGIGTLAVLAKGFPTKDVDLHDGGVWVTNGDEGGLVGRFIVPAEELDAAVALNATSVTELDLLQEGRQVFVSTGTGALRRIDVVNVSLPDEGARIPVPAGIALGGGVVAVVDPSDGRVWVRPATTVDSLDTTSEPEDAKVGGDAAVTVGRDGVVWAVSGDTDRLLTVRLKADGTPEVSTTDLGTDIAQPTITAVGSHPVILSGDGRVVLPGHGEVVLPDSPKRVRLQQSGPASDIAAVATDERLYGVPLAGGEPRVLSPDGTGGPAAPVQVGGCVYAAWSARPTMVRVCPGMAPTPPISLRGPGLTNDPLEFRVNYDLVVLNQLATGAIFTFDRSGENLGNWENVRPPKPDTDQKNDESPQSQRPKESPPVAHDDRYGARPGQATLLPVLENDGDPDGDFVVISSISQVGQDARLNVIANGQALQLVLGNDASGIVKFSYTITDGRGGSDTADVSVTVRRPDQNSPPTLASKQRAVTVEQGGSVRFHVLTDWRDPDGDPLVLVGADTEDPDTVRFTPDGFITFVDANVRFGDKTVKILISDGHGAPREGTVTIHVLAPGALSPPEAHDDRVVGFVGEPLTIEPLLNDTDANVTAPDSSGPLRLTYVSDAPADSTITGRDFQDGTFTFLATQQHTYYLSYKVTQGTDKEAEARIRVDIQAATAHNPPVAVADVVVLRGNAPGTVDVLANDTDLDGDVLVVSSVSVPEDSGLVVSVLEHRWLRVVAPQAVVNANSFQYTVSDGFTTDVGVVTVSRVLDTDDQAPAPRDDTAKVRAGDTVTIDVLANDVDPEGGQLSLGPGIVPDDDTKGHWYVSGDTVRYQAPNAAGTASAHYKVLDPGGNEADALVTVSITDADPSTNQRPNPQALQARVFAGTVTRIHVPLSGVDDDGDSVTLVGATNAPAQGRIVAQGIDYLDYEAYQGKGGTDTFTYLVRDPFGATAEGAVRVGIIPRPAEDSAPVAVDDVYEVAPGATVDAPVLANDSDVDGDPLQLEALKVANPDIGDEARVADNRIVVTAPTTSGQSISVPYAVTDGRGLRSFATLQVTAKEGADVAPTAQDDWATHFAAGATSVDVPVLDNDDDIDGDRDQLTVTPVDDGSGLTAQWLPETQMLRVQLGDRPRQVAYQLTDAAGGSAIAFVHVPPLGDQAPFVRDDVEDITIVGGTQKDIDLTRYIVDAEGQPIRITSPDGVWASPQPGVTIAEGSLKRTSLTLQADPAYSGPATLVVEVTDSDSLLAGHKASLTLNVTVTPAQGRHPTVSCPPMHPRAGAPAIVVDLRSCVLGLTPQQRDALTFSPPQGGPDGVKVELDGAQLRLSAERTIAPGTSGVLHFTIGGPWGNVGAEMTVLVDAAALARANTDEIARADAGEAFTYDVTANDTNPFPDQPLRVTRVNVESGDAQATLQGDGRNIRIAPAAGFHGIVTIVYYLQDALNQPDREVEGRVIVHVIAAPDPPSPPRKVSVGAGRAVVAFTAGNNNGAQIDQYQLQDQSGKQYDCKKSTTCEAPGLTNGKDYRFQVRARNIVGWSDWSGLSPTITPDQRPDQPAAPRTQFGDGKITVSWTEPHNEGTPITQYEIEQSPGDGRPPIKVGGRARNTVVDGLTNGASYTFRVRATNGANPSDWSPWSAPEVPAGVPGTPAAPTAAGVASDIGQQMDVSWTAPADNGAAITSYTLTIIKAGTADGTKTLSGDVTTTTVDVVNGVQYTFHITATNKAGQSPRSPDSAAAVAHGKPAQITSFTVADHDASNHGYDGRVQYSLTPPDDNGQAIVKYEFDYTGDGTQDYSGSGSTGFVTGLSNGTNYQIRVRACNDRCGDWSTSSPTVNPYGQPNTPGAGASANGQTQVNFSWNAPSTNGRALDRLEYRIDGGAWQTVKPAASGNTTQGGYGPGTTHSIEVRVFDATGWESAHASAQATTQSPPAATATLVRGALRPPDGQCSDPSCGYINLTLNNFSPNTTYTIYFVDDRTGVWTSTTRTTDGSGHWSGNTGAFYGYHGNQVWARINGVDYQHYTWPS